MDAAHAEDPGEADFLGPCVEILSKGDQKPKDKAIREQVLVGEEHGASSALRKEGETEGRTVNLGRWVLKSDLERDNSERRAAKDPKNLVASPSLRSP